MQPTAKGLSVFKPNASVTPATPLLTLYPTPNLQAVALHGRSWVKVARLVPGRSEVQCRERWMNVLNPDVRNAAPFTPEEDALILEQAGVKARADGRVRWSSIAAMLPGRTDKAVAIRHAKLLQWCVVDGWW